MPAVSDRDSAAAARYTLVAFHAHPDDEALYTGGTLARASSQGHRVVLVTATSGDRGLALEGITDLGGVRLLELEEAATALGVSRLVTLGYGDSGSDPRVPPPAGSLCAVPVEEVAARLAEVLEQERADTLTIYDPHGGYGHRDHVRVHDAGLVAAVRAGTPLVLEATIPRDLLARAVRLLNWVRIKPGGMTAGRVDGSYRSSGEITHEIDVRPWLAAKLEALEAHVSQASGGTDIRTLQLLTRLPRPLARQVLGREWFVEVGGGFSVSNRRHRAHDPFMSVRDR